MPDALETLATRRSVPANFLVEPGPDPDQLRTILTIGARVPDHGKLVPWRFVVVAGAAGTAAAGSLADLYRKVHPEDAAKAAEIAERFDRVPVSVLVVSRTAPHPKIPEWEQFLASGSVAMNLIHAAHALGYAAQWLTGWVATDPEARALFGVGEGERIVGIIHIGTPDVPPSERPRPDVDAITTFWQPT